MTNPKQQFVDFYLGQAERRDAKFPKGIPADPTKNMSPEQKQVWDDMNEEHRDNFKSASQYLSHRLLTKAHSLCQGTLALLRAQQFMYLTAHWQASGGHAYSDHLLFERLYGENLQTEIDTLAEKLVFMWGADIVDPSRQVQTVSMLVQGYSRIYSCPFKRALKIETDLQTHLKALLNLLEGGMDMGLEDFLQSTANRHDTHLYLLKQRIS